MRRLTFLVFLALAAPMAAAQGSSATASARILQPSAIVGVVSIPDGQPSHGFEFSLRDTRLLVRVDARSAEVAAHVTLPADMKVRNTSGPRVLVSTTAADTLAITIHNR